MSSTETRKVIAFLAPYYANKYGYTPSGSFSIQLDDPGERLFICWNGGFFEPEVALGEKPGSLFLHNAVMLVHSFHERNRGFDDFAAFAEMFGISAEQDRLHSVPSAAPCTVRIGWVRADEQIRST